MAPATGCLSSTARPSAQALAELLRSVEPVSSTAQNLLVLPEFDELVRRPALCSIVQKSWTV
jgi:hypothetical protein